MIHGRKRLSTALLGTAAITAFSLAPVSPAQAEPSIADVQQRVDELYHEAEVAQERYHDANLELTELRKDLSALRADQRRQEEHLGAVKESVADSVLRQSGSSRLSTVGRLVVSEDRTKFLGQLSTMSSYQDMQSAMFERYATELDALELRRQATAEQAREIKQTTEQLREADQEVESKLAKAKDLLGELEAEKAAREQTVSRTRTAPAEAPAPEPAPAASGTAAAAVAYAYAQVGKSYVYGAAGPSAFDCSGLTMMAWSQAGVSLPHSSSGQYSSGTPVSMGSLQPGDLVFYYSPISHVGIYVGNGQIVHAANPSTGVSVAGVNSMPVSGAVRPG